MAKRSDFAQKLLDDLRQRKERLASSSQTSNRSNSSLAIVDAYSYAKQNYRGSKDIRTNDMIGSRTGNGWTKSNNGGRSSFSGDTSQHIVPYNNGRAQSSHQMGDLSMALAFALENGAKIKRTDSSTRSSMLGFLQQIGMRSIDPGKAETRGGNAGRRGAAGGQFPAFSPAQIEDISKGVRRLNQILRACSDGGVNFDQYSIQIGKELLKGAVDLENSLKMLVNLQEASEYSVKPQRKNRIKLLEEGEEDDEEGGVNVAEEWKLDRPRFSFDRASNSKQGSDSRSASFRSNARSVSALGEQKRQPSSSQEKARIPNVIAKLMGLEKLPDTENSSNAAQKTTAPKTKDEAVGRLGKARQEIGKIFGHKAKGGADNVSPPKRQRVAVEANPFVVNTSFVVVRERNVPSSFSLEVVIEGEKPTKSSEKPAAKKERNQEVIMKNGPQATREKQPMELKKSVSEEKKHQSAKPAGKAKGSEAIPKSTLSKSNKQTHLNQDKKKSVKSTNLVQSEVYPNGKHQDEVFRERVSAEPNAFKEAKSSNPDQSFSPRQFESEPRRQRARNVQAMDEKAVNAPILPRIKVPKGNNKNELPRRIDEFAARRSMRQQSSALKEAKKPTRLEKLSVREEAKIKKCGSEAKDQTVSLEQKEADKTFALYTTLKEDVRTRLEEQPQRLSLLCQDVRLDDHLNRAPLCEDQELDCRIDVVNELDNKHGDHHGSESTLDIEVTPSSSRLPHTHDQTMEQAKPAQQPILSESENRLKQILIKSQLFLNTAEALFNLEIPINILHDSSSHNDDESQNDNATDQNDQRRLVLDCGYELMRRKGRRQELAVHPKYGRVSTGLVKVSRFDGLVRELSRDFEKLRMYGRDRRRQGSYGGAEEYLPAMQESDVYGREPDVNCMWDRGWNDGVFAYVEVDEVVRDVEKFVLNALLDEITGDLFLHVAFS